MSSVQQNVFTPGKEHGNSESPLWKGKTSSKPSLWYSILIFRCISFVFLVFSFKIRLDQTCVRQEDMRWFLKIHDSNQGEEMVYIHIYIYYIYICCMFIAFCLFLGHFLGVQWILLFEKRIKSVWRRVMQKYQILIIMIIHLPFYWLVI